MADYYPLLAKALANLPNRSAASTRRAIYERARKALIGQLRSIQPPMPEGDIANEDAALDRAIARLEAEYGALPASAAPSPAAAAKAPPGPPPPAPRPGPPPSPPASGPKAPAPPPPAAPPQTGVASRAPASSAPISDPPSASPPPTPSPSPASGTANPLSKYPPPPLAARRPILGASPATANSAPPAAPAVDSVEPAGNIARPSSAAPPIAAHRSSSADDRGLAPAVAPSPPSALTIPPALRAGADVGRPVAPGRAQAPRRSPWPLIALAVLAGAAGAIAVAAYLWRDAPQDVAVSKAPAEIADKTGQPGQTKIAERVQVGGQNNAAPAPTATPAPAAAAPAESQIPVVTVPVAPVPVGPTHPPDNSQTAAATQAPAAQTPAAPAPATPVAANPAISRAAMLIGNSSDPQKPAVALGNAVWSVIPPTSPTQPSTLAVRIDVDIPDQKMHATVTIRKNADASLPATHTIDLRTTFADGAEIKGIKDMGLPQLRKDDLPSGEAVSGVRVKINDSYYLVGLTRSDADAAHNLDLLSTDNWLDFPLLLNDDRIAKLTFEKGAAGDQVMAQALNAWR